MKYLFIQNEGFSHRRIRGEALSNLSAYDKSEYIAVEDSVYEDLTNRKLMWNNGVLVPNPNYEAEQLKVQNEIKANKLIDRIHTLKQLLTDSDYRAIKYAEGYYTEEEYATYKALRQSYRDEINKLEEELGTING
jgi:hypothetical protein